MRPGWYRCQLEVPSLVQVMVDNGIEWERWGVGVKLQCFYTQAMAKIIRSGDVVLGTIEQQLVALGNV
jgi:hypothetical protein